MLIETISLAIKGIGKGVIFEEALECDNATKPSYQQPVTLATHLGWNWAGPQG